MPIEHSITGTQFSHQSKRRDRGIVAVLVNGGSVAQDEAVDCAASGIPVVVLTGSGRAADALASESADASEPGAATISAVELGDLDTLRAVLTAHLSAPPPPRE